MIGFRLQENEKEQPDISISGYGSERWGYFTLHFQHYFYFVADVWGK